MKISIKMTEVEAEQFGKMVRQQSEMHIMLTDLTRRIVGNSAMKSQGLIDEVINMKAEFMAHALNDERQFAELLKYQDKQRWTVTILKMILGGGVVGVGWLVSFLVK